jgi:transposase
MDNLNSHKAIEVQQMISQTGARLLYLPVYSPEFNPIEMMWSVLKNFIRQFHDSPVKNIQSIIQASLLLITVFLLITGYNSNPFHRCMDNSPIPQNL